MALNPLATLQHLSIYHRHAAHDQLLLEPLVEGFMTIVPRRRFPNVNVGRFGT